MADVLADMNQRALHLAFEHLERNWNERFLPAPGEIKSIGMELWRKEQQSAREGETLREMQDLEQRRREHPEEFVSFGEVIQMLRDRFKTKPGEERTTPAEDAAEAAKVKRDTQAQKVALHKDGKL